MKKHPKIFEEFYKSERKKYCPEIKKIEALEKITRNEYSRYYGSNGKDHIGSPLNTPLTIFYALVYLFIVVFLPIHLSENESILSTFFIILFIAPFVFVLMGAAILIYDNSIRNFIMPFILIIKYKRNISLINFIYLINHSFESYVTSRIDKKIKIDPAIFDVLIKESPTIDIQYKQKMINIKNKDLASKQTKITLDQFIEMADRVFDKTGFNTKKKVNFKLKKYNKNY